MGSGKAQVADRCLLEQKLTVLIIFLDKLINLAVF